jgi:hypothetical protein
MNSKAAAVRSILETTENRAQGCQGPGHSRFFHARTATQDRKTYWRRLMISRPRLILVLLLGLPAALGAQAQQRQWSDLNGLKVGQGIEVIESNMKSHGGEFVAVTDEVITLREKSSDVSVKRENVARISTASGARRGEHAVIGLVAGGLIGAGIGAMAGSGTGFLGGSSRGIAALVGVVIGAPSGAAVGAVLPAHTTIYRAEHISGKSQNHLPAAASSLGGNVVGVP